MMAFYHLFTIDFPNNIFRWFQSLHINKEPYQQTNSFKMLEIVMLHQIPFNPSAVAVKSIAIGILAVVRITLTIDGGNVFPIPAKAHPVVISAHINNCEYPKILR